MEANEPINAEEYLGHVLMQLLELAWQKLGLRPDSLTGKYHTDLAEAKLLIDASNALSELVLNRLGDADRRELQNSIRDLKVNYVNRAGGSA
jgi:hypothetical protein